MLNEPAVQQCCFHNQENIRYRQHGEEIIYHRKEAELQCKKGWTGENCDACAPGWLPPDCSTCRFGFSTESKCTECIQNGLWTGTVNGKELRVRLTFTGDTCSTVAPGKFTNVTHTMCVLCDFVIFGIHAITCNVVTLRYAVYRWRRPSEREWRECRQREPHVEIH